MFAGDKGSLCVSPSEAVGRYFFLFEHWGAGCISREAQWVSSSSTLLKSSRFNDCVHDWPIEEIECGGFLKSLEGRGGRGLAQTTQGCGGPCVGFGVYGWEQ